MSPPTDDRQVDALYGVPLRDFIAARKRLADELKKGGDAAGGRVVAALPKPTLAAWVTNQTVRRAPELLQELLAATDDLATAQRSQGGQRGQGGLARPGDQQRDFHEAQREQRRVISRLTDVARAVLAELGENVGAGALEKVEKNLRWGAISEEDRAAFAGGRVTRDIAAPGFGALVGGGGGAARESAPRPEKVLGPAEDKSSRAPSGSRRAAPGRGRNPSVPPETSGQARSEERARERELAEERRAQLASLREELRQARADSAATARLLDQREGARSTAQRRVAAAEQHLQTVRAVLEAAAQAHQAAIEARAQARTAEAEVRERLERLEQADQPPDGRERRRT